VDDLGYGALESGAFLQLPRRGLQRHPDQVGGEFLVPLAAVLGGHVQFGFDPVRLGVDDGAIHVPENGGQVRRGAEVGHYSSLAANSWALVPHVGWSSEYVTTPPRQRIRVRGSR